jgi:hypothetical protein
LIVSGDLNLIGHGSSVPDHVSDVSQTASFRFEHYTTRRMQMKKIESRPSRGHAAAEEWHG